MAKSLQVTEQNTSPQYAITCKRPDGSLVVLTNTTVTMKLYKGSTQTNMGHEACVIIDGPNAIMGWTPKTGDFSGPGTFKGDVKVTYFDGTFEVLFQQALFKARKLGG